MEDGKSQEEWLTALRELLAKMPRDYRGALSFAADVRHAFMRELASALTGPLNTYAQNVPQGTLEQKRQLAVTINTDLREQGFVLRCPDSGNPATLVGDYRNSEEKSSRFRLQVTDASGKRLRRHGSDRVPPLQIMEAPPRQEHLADRYKRRLHGGEDHRER